MSDAEDSSIETRHRRERKELQSQIQQLKKSATKGEKKKRKEVNEQIAEMERALEERHARELVEQDAVDSVAEKIATKLALEESETTYDVASNDNDAVLTKKLNKQQARKLRKQQEMEAMRLEAEERVRNRPDPKAIEREEMHELLQQHKLCIHEVSKYVIHPRPHDFR
jgi:hypothetical protein